MQSFKYVDVIEKSGSGEICYTIYNIFKLVGYFNYLYMCFMSTYCFDSAKKAALKKDWSCLSKY